ncbi:MAG: hypothetical protein SF162_14365 [bacterium]|nr:hypothetical protein [bacterium]
MFSGRNGHKDIRDRVEDIADDIGGELKDFGKEFGREARENADELKTNVVRQLYETAKSMRREARQRGVRGDSLKSVDGMAKGLERAAHYLKRNSYEDMTEDVEKVVSTSVKRNPMQVLLIVFAIGLVIGLILRNSNPQPQRQTPPTQYPM